MSVIDYFLPKAADETDLTAWSPILPARARVLRTNLFGDAFLVAASGTIHMLERAACSVIHIAPSEEQFWRALREDDDGWQLRSLAHQCQSSGKVLADGQCYAFTTPPILGGRYVVENIWVASWQEWFSFTADLFQQVKDLPNGTSVSLKIVD